MTCREHGIFQPIKIAEHCICRIPFFFEDYFLLVAV
jgi:hypothetical protein